MSSSFHSTLRKEKAVALGPEHTSSFHKVALLSQAGGSYHECVLAHLREPCASATLDMDSEDGWVDGRQITAPFNQNH